MKYVTIKDTTCVNEEDEEMEFADIYRKDILMEEHLANTERVAFKTHWPIDNRNIFLSSSKEDIFVKKVPCKCSSILVVDDNAFNILAIQFLLE
jgi:hypothetical protein